MLLRICLSILFQPHKSKRNIKVENENERIRHLESESPKTNLKVSNGTKNIFYVLTLKSSFVLVITFEFPFGLG